MKKHLVVLIIAAITLSACQAAPEPLKYVVIPADDAGTTRSSYISTVAYLSEAIGREIELIVAPDYSTVVEAMKYGHADIARFGPTVYVRAVKDGIDLKPLVSGIKEATNLPGYYGYILARTDRHVADLNGKTFAFVDVGSTSGYLLPMTHFNREGIEPSKVFMAGSHPAVILAVKNGTVDAGATASSRYEVALSEGVVGEGELEILWQSPLVPNCPITVHGSMNAKLKARIKQAFLDMPREIAEDAGLKEIGYVEICDDDYDIIRELDALNK